MPLRHDINTERGFFVSRSLEIAVVAFLGQIVSKLSPMIGNLLERRIVQLLGDETARPIADHSKTTSQGLSAASGGPYSELFMHPTLWVHSLNSSGATVCLVHGCPV